MTTPQPSKDVVVCRGILIPIDPKIITPKVQRKLSRDFYETPEVMGLPKFIKETDRVLELGAGIGFISTFIATQLNVRQITCIEANPVLCDFITRVHALNGVRYADVRNVVALSDSHVLPKHGTVPFYIADPFWSSSLEQRPEQSMTATDVPAVHLSDVIAEVQPTVIVCDIEGGEVDLFESVDLGNVTQIYMELHTRVSGGAGIMRVFDTMHKQGFFYHQRVSCEGLVLFKKLK